MFTINTFVKEIESYHLLFQTANPILSPANLRTVEVRVEFIHNILLQQINANSSEFLRVQRLLAAIHANANSLQRNLHTHTASLISTHQLMQIVEWVGIANLCAQRVIQRSQTLLDLLQRLFFLQQTLNNMKENGRFNVSKSNEAQSMNPDGSKKRVREPTMLFKYSGESSAFNIYQNRFDSGAQTTVKEQEYKKSKYK